ncbi:MAG: PHB depolymerase family esterase [Burkholderiales bacterium]
MSGRIAAGAAAGGAALATLCILTLPLLAAERGEFLPEASVTSPNGSLVYNWIVSKSRDYRLYIPAGYVKGKPAPLVVMLHGCKQDPESFAAGTRMNRLADEHGFLVLYPRQSALANGYSCWNWFDPRTQARGGEAAIVMAMIDEVAARHSVDANRIYVAGISAGGAFAAILASCYTDVFAAAVVHSGFPYGVADNPIAGLRVMESAYPYDAEKSGQAAFACRGSGRRTMPMLVIHGTEDDKVLPKAAGDVIRQFAQVDDLCDDGQDNDSIAATRLTQKTVAAEPGQRAYVVSTLARDGKPLLQEVLVSGLGHAWSGGDDGRASPQDRVKYPYNDPQGPDASRMMWGFFAQHQLTDNPACAVPK